jgi:uncharacterized protein
MLISPTRHLCPCCGKPRRLAHLLDLYERNFRLLERLIPELELPFEHAVSKSAHDLPLHLTVLDRDRYTVSFKLTYVFEPGEGEQRQPDLVVRVYRDAHVVEALRQPQRPHWLARDEGDPEAARFLDDQWGRNLLLGKWLEYLLEHGHGFGLAGRPRLRPIAA